MTRRGLLLSVVILVAGLVVIGLWRRPNPTGDKGRHYAMAAELRKGGYILYFRHAQRAKWASVLAFDMEDTALGKSTDAAVCLSPQGREEARIIGATLERARVPVGAIVSSPSCRARQTAGLAFGRIDAISRGLLHPSLTNPSNAKAFKEEWRRTLLTVPIDAGKNAVVTAHGSTMERYGDMIDQGMEHTEQPIAETGFYVLRREGQALRIVHKYPTIAELATQGIDLAVREEGSQRHQTSAGAGTGR